MKFCNCARRRGKSWEINSISGSSMTGSWEAAPCRWKSWHGTLTGASNRSKERKALRLSPPDKCQLSDLRNILNHIIRLFFRPHRNLRLEFAMEQSDGMHPQLRARTDRAGR